MLSNIREKKTITPKKLGVVMDCRETNTSRSRGTAIDDQGNGRIHDRDRVLGYENDQNSHRGRGYRDDIGARDRSSDAYRYNVSGRDRSRERDGRRITGVNEVLTTIYRNIWSTSPSTTIYRNIGTSPSTTFEFTIENDYLSLTNYHHIFDQRYGNMPFDRMYIRPCYKDIYDLIVNQRINKVRDGVRHPMSIITGVPGIGKS
eukprot:gene14393-30649_t